MLQKEKSPLQPAWNGNLQEFVIYRNNTLGKILTLIDSVIVNEKQNKSVKDLVRGIIWEDTSAEKMMAYWFNWLDDNYNLKKRNDNGSSEPMKYQDMPAGDFRNYKKQSDESPTGHCTDRRALSLCSLKSEVKLC